VKYALLILALLVLLPGAARLLFWAAGRRLPCRHDFVVDGLRVPCQGRRWHFGVHWAKGRFPWNGPGEESPAVTRESPGCGGGAGWRRLLVSERFPEIHRVRERSVRLKA
jgi:hypothetical protein